MSEYDRGLIIFNAKYNKRLLGELDNGITQDRLHIEVRKIVDGFSEIGKFCDRLELSMVTKIWGQVLKPADGDDLSRRLVMYCVRVMPVSDKIQAFMEFAEYLEEQFCEIPGGENYFVVDL